ncbi:MAG: tetratricopeptide repeat protein [Pseudomonadota bacterium]|nr:tetratricopeptide repeat protein [Pseudomonadota bacterium]MEA3241113.1 tetratricopeptide repeat protein [Pseudomonadota bacterium]
MNMKKTLNKYFLFLTCIYLVIFLGSLYFSVVSLKKAMAFATIRTYSINGEKLLKKGKAAIAKTLWHKGDKLYQQIENKPGYYTQGYKGFHDAGQCLYRLGKHQQAIAAFNQALRLHPYSISDLGRRAAAADKIGNYELVIESLSLCEQIYPLNWHVAYNLADAYRRTDKLAQAVPYYQQAWDRNPKKIPILLQLINSHLTLGNLDEAGRLIKQVKNRKIKPKERQYLTRAEKIIPILRARKAREAEKPYGPRTRNPR